MSAPSDRPIRFVTLATDYPPVRAAQVSQLAAVRASLLIDHPQRTWKEPGQCSLEPVAPVLPVVPVPHFLVADAEPVLGQQRQEAAVLVDQRFVDPAAHVDPFSRSPGSRPELVYEARDRIEHRRATMMADVGEGK